MLKSFRSLLPLRVNLLPLGQEGSAAIDVPEGLRRIICAQLSLPEATGISSDLRFCEDLRCDSLDVLQLVVMTEEHYGIKISDEMVEEIVTVGDAIIKLGIENRD